MKVHWSKKKWHELTLWHNDVWVAILRRDPCTYCGLPSDSVEHVDPRGSRSPIVNGVGACRSCNSERGSAPLLVYLMWRMTDRSLSFPRWNWQQHPRAIRESQRLGKAAKKAEKLARRILKPEPQVPVLRVTIAESVHL